MPKHDTLTSLNELVHLVGKRTELGNKMFYYLIDNGLLDIGKIDIDPTVGTSWANSHEKSIILATAPIDEKERYRLAVRGLSPEDADVHAFLHEMAHLFINNTGHNSSTQALASMTNDIRRDNYYDRGLGMISPPLWLYPSAQRWEEDSAELIALRLRSAMHLSRFVLRLTREDQASVDERSRLGLASLTVELATDVEAVVNNALTPIRGQE